MGVCVQPGSVYMRVFPPMKRLKQSNFPEDSHSEGLSLMRLKEVAEASKIHLTLEKPVGDEEWDLEVSTDCLSSRSLKRLPSKGWGWAQQGAETCLLLLRVFTTNNGRHHRMDEFSRGNVPSSELQIYTWMDATLKELTSLVKEVYPEARKKGTHFNFAIVFTDVKRPGYRVKEIGSTMSGRKGTDDSITLQSQKFQIGDYLDVAITPPNRAPPSLGRMRPY
nr:histone deacetylase complex subunit SAP18-like [Saimiri boliviensis boliviensis]